MILKTAILNLNISPEVETSKGTGNPPKKEAGSSSSPLHSFQVFFAINLWGGGCHVLVKVGDSDSGCILKPTYRDPRCSVAGALLAKRVRRPLV